MWSDASDLDMTWACTTSCARLLTDPAWFFSIAFSSSFTWCYYQFSFKFSKERDYSGFVSWPRIAWSWKSCEKAWRGANSTPHWVTEKRREWLWLNDHLSWFWLCWLSKAVLTQRLFSSVAQLCPTLCDPMNCSTPGLPVHHQFPEFIQTHVHWWCHPAISSSVVPFYPAPNPSQHQSLFQWVNSSHEEAKVLEFQL